MKIFKQLLIVALAVAATACTSKPKSDLIQENIENAKLQIKPVCTKKERDPTWALSVLCWFYGHWRASDVMQLGNTLFLLSVSRGINK